jgi:hypothetical protein
MLQSVLADRFKLSVQRAEDAGSLNSGPSLFKALQEQLGLKLEVGSAGECIPERSSGNRGVEW